MPPPIQVARRLRPAAILLPLTLSLLVASAPAAAKRASPPAASSGGDEVIQQMRQASQRGDSAKLTQLLPRAKGHILEPWAAYWEMKARLEAASPSEVNAFLARYAGSYQEDRLRADWLLATGKRGQWDHFGAALPGYRLGDDPHVRCYAIVADALRSGEVATRQVLEVSRRWFGL